MSNFNPTPSQPQQQQQQDAPQPGQPDQPGTDPDLDNETPIEEGDESADQPPEERDGDQLEPAQQEEDSGQSSDTSDDIYRSRRSEGEEERDTPSSDTTP